MCAKYLVRLMGMNGISANVTSDEINKYINENTDAETAHAVAVLHKYGVLNGNDGFDFLPDKEITRGEMVYMLARTLKLYK